jgi:hypothetical protein
MNAGRTKDTLMNQNNNQNNRAQDTLVAEKQTTPASEQTAARNTEQAATKNMEQAATRNAEQAAIKNTDQGAIRNDVGGERRPEGQPLGKPGEGSARPMAHPPEDAFEAERTRREPVKSGI